MDYARYPGRSITHLFTAPFIYSVVFPVALLDLVVEIYHRTCFPVYGIPLVPRRRFIRIDRHRLSYLRWYDKINCAYCGYVNGVIRYAEEIAARTERYWCGIRHAPGGDYAAPGHHEGFAAYGDVSAYDSLQAAGTPPRNRK